MCFLILAGKSKIKVPIDPVSGGPASWFADGHFSAYPHVAKREARWGWWGWRMGVGRGRGRASSPLTSLLVRALIPSWGLHSYDLITFQRPHLLIPSLKVKISTHELSGDTKHSVHNNSPSNLGGSEHRKMLSGRHLPLQPRYSGLVCVPASELSRKIQQDWTSAPGLKEERTEAIAQNNVEPTWEDSQPCVWISGVNFLVMLHN